MFNIILERIPKTFSSLNVIYFLSLNVIYKPIESFSVQVVNYFINYKIDSHEVL